MNNQYHSTQTQAFTTQVSTSANQIETTQDFFPIHPKTFEYIMRLAINNLNQDTTSKSENTKERLITLELHVKQIQSDIQEIKSTIQNNKKDKKEDKKFTISTSLAIVSIIVACIAVYFSYQTTQPKEIPVQSSESSHMPK